MLQTIVADRIPQTAIAIGGRVEHARRAARPTQYPPRIAGGKPGDGTGKLRGKAPLDVAHRERTQVPHHRQPAATRSPRRPACSSGRLPAAPGRKGQVSASESIADAIARPGSRGVIARRPSSPGPTALVAAGSGPSRFMSQSVDMQTTENAATPVLSCHASLKPAGRDSSSTSAVFLSTFMAMTIRPTHEVRSR